MPISEREIFPFPLVTFVEARIDLASPVASSNHRGLIDLVHNLDAPTVRVAPGYRTTETGIDPTVIQFATDTDAMTLFQSAVYFETTNYVCFEDFAGRLSHWFIPLADTTGIEARRLTLRYIDEIPIDPDLTDVQTLVTIPLMPADQQLAAKVVNSFGAYQIVASNGVPYNVEWVTTEVPAIPDEHVLAATYAKPADRVLVLEWTAEMISADISNLATLHAAIKEGFDIITTDACRHNMRQPRQTNE